VEDYRGRGKKRNRLARKESKEREKREMTLPRTEILSGDTSPGGKTRKARKRKLLNRQPFYFWKGEVRENLVRRRESTLSAAGASRV